jgi:Domain of unknown function (DUF6456)
MNFTADETIEIQCRRILEHLEATEAVLSRAGAAWVAKGAAAGRVEIPQPAVAALLARGHLVPHRSGGLVARSVQLRRGSRMTSHRPPRPREGAGLPTVNDAESPLSWLRSRSRKDGKPLIGDEQFLAGERLRSDYEKSRLERRITSSWDATQTANAPGGNKVADMTDAMITARQNVHAALDAVGPELSGMLMQVCCLAAGIEQAERALDMPQRAGKAVLALALTSLARHYGFIRPSRGSDRAAATGHWAIAGYRPAIPPQAAS